MTKPDKLMREAFEEWKRSEGETRSAFIWLDSGHYNDSRIQGQYMAFRAGWGHPNKHREERGAENGTGAQETGAVRTWNGMEIAPQGEVRTVLLLDRNPVKGERRLAADGTEVIYGIPIDGKWCRGGVLYTPDETTQNLETRTTDGADGLMIRTIYILNGVEMEEGEYLKRKPDVIWPKTPSHSCPKCSGANCVCGGFQPTLGDNTTRDTSE